MYKKVLTACLALTLAVSMTACGDTDDSGKSKESKAESSTVSQTEESKPADESKADESESAQDSEEETPIDPADIDMTACYQLLDAEYQKYGRVDSGTIAQLWSGCHIADGLCLMIRYYNNRVGYLFDEDGNVTDLIESAGFIAAYQVWYNYYYNGGYIFSTNEDENAVIMTDLKGNVIKNIEVPGVTGVPVVTENGDAIIQTDSQYYI